MKQKNVIISACLAIVTLIVVVLLIPDSRAYLKTMIFKEVSDTSKYERMEGFSDMEDQVIVKKDIEYSADDSNMILDVYMPKKTAGTKKPTIFWAHGGAFIAGDKRSVSDYSVMLASQGYVVVNMNYGLAPEFTYPAPLEQVAEAYLYMVAHADDYDVNWHRVAFGGDSAGGQIIGQFVNLQVNDAYAEQLDMEPVVKKGTIRGVIFFSALLDLNKYDENENENANEVFDKSAQVYFELEKWKHSDKVNRANIVGNVDEHFPPTYLTDGNTASFQEQAEELTEELENENVPVRTTFFPPDEAELRHEYQFNMEKEQSVENYKQVSAFLEKHLK